MTLNNIEFTTKDNSRFLVIHLDLVEYLMNHSTLFVYKPSVTTRAAILL